MHDEAMVRALVEDLQEAIAESEDGIALRAQTRFGIRTRSPLAREVLERAGHLGALGTVIALSDEPDAYERGLSILDRALRESGLAATPEDVLTTRAQLLFRTDRDEDLQSLLDEPDLPLSGHDRWTLRTDLLNPHRRPSTKDSGSAGLRWLESFNEVFVAQDLEPIELLPGTEGTTPYQRLTAATSDRVDGELVSVVMSAYQPHRHDLLMAVRGVLSQTWHNLELLVVDDASTSGSETLLDEVEAMDPRVRVVRAPHNRGTYEARNLALTIARGRWMTFQDSDDWTHPRRLEHQVNHLELSGDVIANRTWTLRAFPDLTMTYVGYPAERLNASSLLFDRMAVSRLVGDFDSTRKSGDVELPLRLQTIRPHSVQDLTSPAPLAITQLRTSSLSRDDSLPGWIRWDRLSYRDSYREWHRQIRAGRESAVLPSLSGQRPFPLPRPSWEPVRSDSAEGIRWDVVVLGDLRWKAHGVRRALGVARTLAHLGLRTAMAHGEAHRPLSGALSTALPGVSSDVRLGRVGLTDVHEDDECDLLVVTEPASVLHLDAASLRTQRLLVVADEADTDGWSVPDVERRCLELFGVAPLWGGPAGVHNGPDGPSSVRLAVPDASWCAADLPVTTGVGWQQVGRPSAPRPHERRLAGRPTRPFTVMGHHLADSTRRWPDTPADLGAAYPNELIVFDDGVTAALPAELHVLQGLKRPLEVMGLETRPASWITFAGRDLTPREFLSHIDVWVYFGEWDAAAELGLLEAQGAGLPCVVGLQAAHVDLTGPVRCVAPALAREAIEELLAEPASGPTTADLRQDEWGSAVRGLLATPRLGAAMTTS